MKISINKDIFEKILSKNISTLEKVSSSFWKKELLEIKIVDDKIVYKPYKFEKIVLTNGLGEDKPQLIIELKNIEYLENRGVFIFYFGNILEQKNILNLEDEKDILIKKLLDEKKELRKILDELKKSQKF
ncbi:hypothetical protein [Arcobacter vandammei]|uniref:hypothetical protein n=1 Tax=Arcobacter vandammei TaxID=2782243 RepID=UPI0018DFAFA9|nr:hypothetical protein [Arcobacter vandammei]